MPTVPYPLSAYGLPADIRLPVGFDAVYPFTIQSGFDTAVTVFTSGDTLAASVWPGDDRAQTFAPTMAWVSAPAGTATLTIAAASTTSLAAGQYRLLASVTVSGVKCQLHDGTLTLTPVAGSGTAGTYYATFDDMVREFSTVGDLASKSDQAGFVEQRAEAREWFDKIILRHYHGQQSSISQTRFDVYGYNLQRSGLLDPTLKQYLTDDKLIVTKAVRRANACYAVSRVLQAQVSANGESQYAKLAGRFLAIAETIAANTTVEIDTDANGEGDIPIDLGVIDVLRG